MPWWWGYTETVSPRPPRLHRISTPSPPIPLTLGAVRSFFRQWWVESCQCDLKRLCLKLVVLPTSRSLVPCLLQASFGASPRSQPWPNFGHATRCAERVLKLANVGRAAVQTLVRLPGHRPHSPPTRVPFSATDRFIRKMIGTSASIITANTQKQSK